MFPHQKLVHAPPPFAVRVTPISFFLILSPAQYCVSNTGHEAPHYEVFSTFMSPRPT
jgi:hypothetical protein